VRNSKYNATEYNFSGTKQKPRTSLTCTKRSFPVAFSLEVSFSTALLVVGIEKAQMQVNAHIPSNIIHLSVSNATAECGTLASNYFTQRSRSAALVAA
jgi:hypothetical protein